MGNQIYSFKNFISPEEAEDLIIFINTNESLGFSGKHGKGHTIPLGAIPLDGTKHREEELSKITLSSFPTNIQQIINRLSTNACTTVESISPGSGVHASNIFLAKQSAGGIIRKHLDSADWDRHLQYSAVVYLNKISDGEICFPEINYCYQPEGLDMLLFKSDDPTLVHEVSSISEDRYTVPIFMGNNPEYYIR